MIVCMKKESLRDLTPGPKATHPLPEVLPVGIMPAENSKIWCFVGKAVQQGEPYIQDDTREWFDQKGRQVAICREYPDHPRWQLRDTVRADIYNRGIVSEIHMLARLEAGLADVPAWVPAKMTVKQVQSDIGYRLAKATRETFLARGKEALEVFAERSPGQFIKFVASTFVPKQIEANVSTTAAGVDPETIDTIMLAIMDELKQRDDEMKVVNATPLDYDPPKEIVDSLKQTAAMIHQATEPGSALGVSKNGEPLSVSQSLNKVVDLEADGTDDDHWW